MRGIQCDKCKEFNETNACYEIDIVRLDAKDEHTPLRKTATVAWEVTLEACPKCMKELGELLLKHGFVKAEVPK